MSTFPWLTVTMAIPAVGALLLAVIPGAGGASEAGAHARNLLAKRVALVVSLLTLAVTIAMIASFKPDGAAFQFTQTYQWIPQFGIHYAVGVDGIGLVLIGMTAVLMRWWCWPRGTMPTRRPPPIPRQRVRLPPAGPAPRYRQPPGRGTASRPTSSGCCCSRRW